MPTLLLADDSVTVQRVIALTFAEEPSFQVVAVSDGRQVLEKMAGHKPDIVLAGTTLPHVNGYELARQIRNRPGMQQTPVLLLMGAFESVDEALLRSSGANGVLEKPVEPPVVINRVKELLGLKSDTTSPAQTGRLITSSDGPAGAKLPVATPPRAVTSTRPSPAAARQAAQPSSWDELRHDSGLGPDARSVEDATTRTNDLDSLDAAFDTLDMQLSGRAAPAKQRNPAGPLAPGQASGDPRSPVGAPAQPATGANSVFEVDESWFGDTESPAQAGRREISEDLRDPQLAGERAAAAAPVFEVDEQWFGEEKATPARHVGHDSLVAEMGIHDIELPPIEPQRPVEVPSDLRVTAADLDLLAPAPARGPEAEDVPRQQDAAPVSAPVPVPLAPPVHAASLPAPRPVAPVPAAANAVADDFAALLAFEQGESPAPIAAPAPSDIRVVAPDMLDAIAARVADRLSAAAFGDRLRDSMAAAVRDTVRAVVSDTSERLVREEIDRIKNKRA